jgi:hypothetical protein
MSNLQRNISVCVRSSCTNCHLFLITSPHTTRCHYPEIHVQNCALATDKLPTAPANGSLTRVREIAVMSPLLLSIAEVGEVIYHIHMDRSVHLLAN